MIDRRFRKHHFGSKQKWLTFSKANQLKTTFRSFPLLPRRSRSRSTVCSGYGLIASRGLIDARFSGSFRGFRLVREERRRIIFTPHHFHAASSKALPSESARAHFGGPLHTRSCCDHRALGASPDVTRGRVEGAEKRATRSENAWSISKAHLGTRDLRTRSLLICIRATKRAAGRHQRHVVGRARAACKREKERGEASRSKARREKREESFQRWLHLMSG